jgi:hypothetical protein
MNITPTRALELAERSLNFFDNLGMSEKLEISACLKSYAEIAPRWQAALDAEPVVYVKLNEDGAVIAGIKVRMAGYQDDFQPAIIKPAP